MHFAVDTLQALIALSFGIACLAILKLRPQKKEPTLFFSNLALFPSNPPSWRQRFAKLPDQLAYLALFLFLAAFANPHLFLEPSAQEPEKKIPSEGLAIYLLLDQSGSMEEYVDVPTSEGKDELIQKKELLKDMTKDFVEGNTALNLPGRPNDLIGVIAFARSARILAPLTLDHQAILNLLSSFDAVHKPEEDGTAIGYAIFKTVNLIAATRHFGEELLAKGQPAYTIKNSVIIVVTDGFQFPSPLDKGSRLRNIDLDEAARYAKDEGVKIYLINVDPTISEPEYDPQRHQMKRITELTGGGFYPLSENQNLSQIYAEIDRLEKSTLPTEASIDSGSKEHLQNKRISFYPYLIACGMLCLALSIILKTTFLKRVP